MKPKAAIERPRCWSSRLIPEGCWLKMGPFSRPKCLVSPKNTPAETNIFAENGWLEDYLLSFGDFAYFQGRTVSLPKSKGFL